MSRKERRAAKSQLKKLPDQIPNISSTNECCVNCRFAADPKRVAMIRTILAARALSAGQPAPQPMPDDEVWCLAEPSERSKKTFGWCGKWEAKS